MLRKIATKKRSHKIGVLDLETDPFLHGRVPQPFAAGWYDGHTFKPFWGDDCVTQLVAYLRTLKTPYVIFAHNGGRFDYFYLLDHIRSDLRIVNSRIIQAKLGIHELRDSFAIMPFPLESYHKTKIDYDKFTHSNRDKNRTEILSYLRDDCIDLHVLCTAFFEEFGDSLTIGSASMKQLKKFHSFKTGDHIYDTRIRTDFYFGGRNQVFEAGVLTGTFNIYDVNSMYPYVMRDFLHPTSTGIYRSKQINDRTAFVTSEGYNYGAFPVRQKNNSLDFTIPFGIFHTSIHEFQIALACGAFRPTRIIETLGWTRRESFADFVTHFYDARTKAKETGDKIKTLFYKFVMNSSYGKFAQNPENYFDWFICEQGEFPLEWHVCKKSCPEPCRSRWEPAFISQNGFIIWKRPLKTLNFFNVATGASITGAARAVLLQGISHAKRVVYCDTDSLICERLDEKIDDTTLGAWKLEATGSMVAICGKKLYAVFDAEGECIKKAHKGARLTGNEILAIARGATVENANPVPAFKWDGTAQFVTRTLRQTAV